MTYLYYYDYGSPEGERTQGPVRLVAARIAHCGAPEVVPERGGERIQCQHVLVHGDRGNVVVHKVAVHPVQVAGERYAHHYYVNRSQILIAITLAGLWWWW